MQPASPVATTTRLSKKPHGKRGRQSIAKPRRLRPSFTGRRRSLLRLAMRSASLPRKISTSATFLWRSAKGDPMALVLAFLVLILTGCAHEPPPPPALPDEPVVMDGYTPSALPAEDPSKGCPTLAPVV